MRKHLLIPSLFLGSLALNLSANSQQADRFAFAVTDIVENGNNWSYLRKLDLSSGQFSEVLLNGTDPKQIAYDATTKKIITQFATEQNRGFHAQPAFGSMVAAMAYDRKNNRLWYTPMFIDQLRYIDLKTMKVFYFASQDFTGMAKKSPDQGNIITRMTIGDDGFGYALTNDGTHLVRFSTGKKLTVTDLGTLVDDPASKGQSIHSSCTSFGGDMIADNKGNLLVFSARNHVFQVNIETKIATHLGAVTGIPATFTSNGAAVTDENKIIINSAVDGSSYLVDIKTLAATPYQLGAPWRSSDLANSNILNRNKTPLVEAVGKTIPGSTDIGSDLVQVFPNPVTDHQFSLLFSKIAPGEYNLLVTDVMGRQVQQRIVNVTGTDQTEKIRLSPSEKGFYLVQIVDKNSKAVFSKKLIVQ